MIHGHTNLLLDYLISDHKSPTSFHKISKPYHELLCPQWFSAKIANIGIIELQIELPCLTKAEFISDILFRKYMYNLFMLNTHVVLIKYLNTPIFELRNNIVYNSMKVVSLKWFAMKISQFKVHMYIYKLCTSEFLISFELWAKLAQQRLVCAPLGIHLEPINIMLLVTT